MPIHIPEPQGDLSKCIVEEPNREWPSAIEVVAYWKPEAGGKGIRKSITIPGDQFFGLTTGAPMSGEQLIGAIERLRRAPIVEE